MRYRLVGYDERGRPRVLWQAELPSFIAALTLAAWSMPEPSYPDYRGLTDWNTLDILDAPQCEQRQGRGKCIARLSQLDDAEDDDCLLLAEDDAQPPTGN